MISLFTVEVSMKTIYYSLNSNKSSSQSTDAFVSGENIINLGAFIQNLQSMKKMICQHIFF